MEESLAENIQKSIVFVDSVIYNSVWYIFFRKAAYLVSMIKILF